MFAGVESGAPGADQTGKTWKMSCGTHEEHGRESEDPIKTIFLYQLLAPVCKALDKSELDRIMVDRQTEQQIRKKVVGHAKIVRCPWNMENPLKFAIPYLNL